MELTLSNKKMLVTGATNGVGKAAALILAKQNAHLILVGRNQAKTEETVRQIQVESGNQRVDYLVADLSVQAEVRRLAAEYRHRYDTLHVLVNNAGAIFMQRKFSQDGLEMTFALNHLAYFTLTSLLLDLMIASAPARIINVTSNAHFGARANYANLNNGFIFNGWRAYSLSKLMNVHFTYELARRLEGSQLTVNCLHPGFVATNFGKNNPGIIKSIFSLAHLVAITPEKGAETIIYLASSPEVEGVTGRYFYNKKDVRSSGPSYDEKAARRLWELSLKLTALGK
jgi:NAD(P)-dependent dehydrogenase (short-subunit alcohol dehydrogenase family)